MATTNQQLIDKVSTSEVYRTHYSNFVRSDKNLRTNVEREALKAQIKADLGVKIPGYVYPADRNLVDPETGKSMMVIFDMNSRHWCIEQLANDEEYLKDGGNLELPYLILPEEVANNPVRERLFMISLGTTNEQLTPLEVGKGYMEALELGIEIEIETAKIDFESLSDEEKEDKLKKIRTKIIKEIIKESGRSKNYIYKIFRVMESVDDNPTLAEALENGKLTLASAHELIKDDTEVEKTLIIANKVAASKNKNTISENDITDTRNILKHPELAGYVEEGKVNPKYVDDVLKAAKAAKTDVETVVTNTLFEGEVNTENLNRVISIMGYDTNDLGDSEGEETDSKPKKQPKKADEKVSITEEDLAKAKDSCSSFSLLLSSLEDVAFTTLPSDKLIILGDKLEGIYQFLQKNIEAEEIAE